MGDNERLAEVIDLYTERLKRRGVSFRITTAQDPDTGETEDIHEMIRKLIERADSSYKISKPIELFATSLEVMDFLFGSTSKIVPQYLLGPISETNYYNFFYDRFPTEEIKRYQNENPKEWEEIWDSLSKLDSRNRKFVLWLFVTMIQVKRYLKE